MLSLPLLGARLVIAGLLLGSIASCGASNAVLTCTPVSPAGFKSRVIPQFYTADQPSCLNKFSSVTPTGKRPVCAVTSWNPATQLCSITGVRPGCACYEGQAHACNLGAAGSPAAPCTTGTNCGVVTCNVVNDSSATWTGCTSLCSCTESAAASTSTAAPEAVAPAALSPAPAAEPLSPASSASPVAPAPAVPASASPAPVPSP
jgi:hypothetical protein